MKVVVGLGNPGGRYAGTRHNVGYAAIDSLARSPGVERFQNRFQAQIAESRQGETKVLLVKPETFMNLSGRCVRQVIDFYQLEVPDLLVICDDVNLPLGKIRLRQRGTHGGHNGLRDIQAHLGTNEYSRLRLGVDLPGGSDMVDYVLGRFRPSEQAVMDEAIEKAAQAVTVWVERGIDVCMNQYNG
jgi:PTH1 family peptidyl-tRNA hydrolase